MRLEKGDMMTALESSDLFCVSSNSNVRRDNTLPLGHGVAERLELRFPGLSKMCGERIVALSAIERCYNFATVQTEGYLIGLLQTRIHWRENPGVWIIEESLKQLDDYVRINRLQNVHVELPGLDQGFIVREAILSLIAPFTEKVTFWEP